jgi:hypothetical protein
MPTIIRSGIFCLSIYKLYQQKPVRLDSVVGIAIYYGMVSPGIVSRWGKHFPHPSSPALIAHTVSYEMDKGVLSLE